MTAKPESTLRGRRGRAPRPLGRWECSGDVVEPTQIRETTDFERAESTPSAATKSWTARVETHVRFVAASADVLSRSDLDPPVQHDIADRSTPSPARSPSRSSGGVGRGRVRSSSSGLAQLQTWVVRRPRITATGDGRWELAPTIGGVRLSKVTRFARRFGATARGGPAREAVRMVGLRLGLSSQGTVAGGRSRCVPRGCVVRASLACAERPLQQLLVVEER